MYTVTSAAQHQDKQLADSMRLKIKPNAQEQDKQQVLEPISVRVYENIPDNKIGK